MVKMRLKTPRNVDWSSRICDNDYKMLIIAIGSTENKLLQRGRLL